jgi:hypothetical protein
MQDLMISLSNRNICSSSSGRWISELPGQMLAPLPMVAPSLASAYRQLNDLDFSASC